MEFASEMVVKAAAFGLRVTESPRHFLLMGATARHICAPGGMAWRHLRFLLLYSPRWLFLYPGIALFVLGTVVSALLIPGRG